MFTRPLNLKIAFVVGAGAALLGYSTSVFASTRLIPFSGIASSEVRTLELNLANSVATCTITIANLSSVDQQISDVQFLDYDTTQKITVWKKADQIWKRGLDSNAISDSSCSGTILPGTICFFRKKLIPYTAEARYAVCTGKIQVADDKSSKPGTVVASGALSIYQESQVVGGALSGALYSSGTANFFTPGSGLKLSDNLAGKDLPDSGTLTAEPSYTTNMNFVCFDACKKFKLNWSDKQCQIHCGSYSYSTTTDISTSEAIALSGSVVKIPQLKPNWKAENTQPPIPDDEYFIKKTDPGMGGGLVLEMISGPFISICSGNKDYHTQGGVDHHHTDGSMQGDTNFGGSEMISERLYCGHRHQKSDLLSRVGSTSPFPINGGVAF